MNDDKCKICNLTITNYDSVKVCPDCGECYHKSCYENFGCKNPDCKKDNDVNKCSACDSVLSKDAMFCQTCGKKVETKKNVCKKCGNELNSNSNFCPVCGFNINYSSDVSLSQEETKKEDRNIDEFVGNNFVYYKRVFKQMEVTNKKVTWNWCSFLFGGSWFVYRKMWVPAIIYMVLTTTLTALQFFGIITNDLLLIIDMILSIASGMFGNFIYMNYVNKKVKQMENMDDDQKFYFCKTKGRTSFMFVLIYFFIALVASSTFL